MLATQTRTDEHTVQVTRTFHAGQQALFRAWTDPQALVKWFGPKGVQTTDAVVDLRVGGAYRIVMRKPEGETIEHMGAYREIVAPEKLVFTWLLKNQACEGSENEDAETLVTLYFRRLSEHETELTLLHENLPGEKARAGHEFGWNSSFECLDLHLESAKSGD